MVVGGGKRERILNWSEWRLCKKNIFRNETMIFDERQIKQYNGNRNDVRSKPA